MAISTTVQVSSASLPDLTTLRIGAKGISAPQTGGPGGPPTGGEGLSSGGEVGVGVGVRVTSGVVGVGVGSSGVVGVGSGSVGVGVGRHQGGIRKQVGIGQEGIEKVGQQAEQVSWVTAIDGVTGVLINKIPKQKQMKKRVINRTFFNILLNSALSLYQKNYSCQ